MRPFTKRALTIQRSFGVILGRIGWNGSRSLARSWTVIWSREKLAGLMEAKLMFQVCIMSTINEYYWRLLLAAVCALYIAHAPEPQLKCLRPCYKMLEIDYFILEITLDFVLVQCKTSSLSPCGICSSRRRRVGDYIFGLMWLVYETNSPNHHSLHFFARAVGIMCLRSWYHRLKRVIHSMELRGLLPRSYIILLHVACGFKKKVGWFRYEMYYSINILKTVST